MSARKRPSKVHDLLDLQNARKAHTTSFVLWPKAWKKYKSTLCRNWAMAKLSPGDRPKVPRRSGIYTMLIQPGIATHPSASFPMYVGQAKDLFVRFNNYLTIERKPEGRPRIVRLLNLYEKHIWFCFCEVRINKLDSAENALINAFDPPCNDRVEAELSAAKRAF